MSEEMNRREAELNERELSGVSGGADRDRAYWNALDTAARLCSSCCKADHSKTTCRSEHLSDFADYILKNGSVHATRLCPYFND